jgi:hypothetical protein
MNRIMICVAIAIAGFGCWAVSGYCYESNGKRDPFVPLIGLEKENRPSGLEDIDSIDEVFLAGIAIGPMGKNVAILNGQMVKEKDRFGLMQINKISKKAVELSIEGKNYKLDLQDEEGIQVGK